MKERGALVSWLNKPWVMSLFLFAIAFVPRLVAAGAYVTVDEQRWVERSVDFMYNLSRGDLASISSLHPGVTTTWGFGLALVLRFQLAGDLSSLWQMRADNYYHLPDLLPTAAIFTALVTSLTVAAAYFLLRKLAGKKVALLAALLIALDPNLLAHSRRVHLDAILASFMYISALSLLVYVAQDDQAPSRRYLILSAVMTGLAWLTKLPALYLIPFTLLALAGRYVLSLGRLRWDWPTLWREAKSFFLWLAIACLVFVALWPAMWVNASHVLSELVRVSFWGVVQPHRAPGAETPPMQFFMGQPVSDPGPGYYPLISLFRMAPVAFLFLPVSIVAVVAAQKKKRVPSGKALAFWLGIAYVVFFVIMLSLGAKKLESYVLPIFPMVDTLAAVGLVAAMRWLAGKWQRRRAEGARPTSFSLLYGLAIAAIVLTSILWLRLAPHYSTYFNPLLGGVPAATRIFVFGGGEGLDMAARYLNEKENPQDISVATPYDDSVFRYYFEGDAQPAGRKVWPASWLLDDYVIGYFGYMQRELPSTEVVEYLEALEPEYTASINGTDYAKVYRVPPLVLEEAPSISHPAQIALGDEVTFLGYDLDPESIESGGTFSITLYWQPSKPLSTDYSVYLRLENGVHHVWGAHDASPVEGLMPTHLWQEGMILADRHKLQIWPGTPPGAYQVVAGMYDPATMRHLEPANGEPLVLGPVQVQRGLLGGPPVPQRSVNANLDEQVRLVGYDLPGEGQPGTPLRLTLYWEALAQPKDDYTVFVHMIDADGQTRAQKDGQPVTGFYPTRQWTAGEFIRDQYDVPIPEGTPPGEYALVVGMYQANTGERLPLLAENGTTAGDRVQLGTIQVEQP